ncbi:MAG: methenyltetrahydromethanopterin cyclohydrolase [Candidatus Bathyarchaeota archaeon]|nr:MAG: methenyltetrahydromethanopterin cyclohydrolase [Candidatus Bathyarchaeota archaeon]
MNSHYSVNNNTMPIINKIIDNPEKYGLIIEESQGIKIFDAGIKAKGSYQAGKILTEICLGGYGSTNISMIKYNDLELPSIQVYTDLPSIATLGSQFAGWRIKVHKYQAIGSGPARALALKPKELYKRIDYRDFSDNAIIVLETAKKPSIEVLQYISNECNVESNKLFVFLVPTSCLAGSIQVSGRIVETGLHKLMEVGFNPNNAVNGIGYAPISPVHPTFIEAMGRTNDMILYGGVVHFTVKEEKDKELKKLVELVPSWNSKDYGKPFSEIFKKAGYDFYKIDPALFAPAVITINNINTGSFFTAGQINTDVLKQSITFQ